MNINRWCGKEAHDIWANLTYREATDRRAPTMYGRMTDATVNYWHWPRKNACYLLTLLILYLLFLLFFISFILFVSHFVPGLLVDYSAAAAIPLERLSAWPRTLFLSTHRHSVVSWPPLCLPPTPSVLQNECRPPYFETRNRFVMKHAKNADEPILFRLIIFYPALPRSDFDEPNRRISEEGRSV